MAVNYKIYQSKANNASKGLYYARAAYRESVGLKKLAEIMQANCTVKYSDILAVLTELAEVMKTELLNSNSVKIEGLGTFRVTLKSKGCANLKEFKPQNHIIGARVRFAPEVYKDIVSGKRVKPMLAGMKVAELDDYKSVKRADVTKEEPYNQSGDHIILWSPLLF